MIIPYGTPEWYDAKLGVPSASNFHKLFTPGGKASKAETTRTYMLQLIAERLLGISSEKEVQVLMMERGKLLESAAARQFRENYYDLDEGGFYFNEQLKAGCSPDAIVSGKPEAVEIKCPDAHTLIGYHLDGLGTDYRPQVQGQILVGNYKCVHFYAWHPRCPPFYMCTLPDFEYIEGLRKALATFTTTLESDVVKARQYGIFLPVAAPPSQDEPDAVNILQAG